MNGSDCVTGKRQFANREVAQQTAKALSRRSPGLRPSAFRCSWCECWHVGNRRAEGSKHRSRR